MQKKLLFLFMGFSLTLFIVLSTFLFTESSRINSRTNKIKEDAASQTIEDFTYQYFRFTEKVRIKTDDGKIRITTSFAPEVGSFPVKEDIYENISYHAVQIQSFYPEVNHFEYIVLWDDKSREESMYLTINEDALKNLKSNYYMELMNRNSGFETYFSRIFSSIIETEESKSWRERSIIDLDSNVP